ncbi:MAG: hypothetical protein CMP11_01805 [Zetaproteobacteria bacterium]|nr:hypothetical protein [Pseudobdellovibrionaceae bacterium]
MPLLNYSVSFANNNYSHDVASLDLSEYYSYQKVVFDVNEQESFQLNTDYASEANLEVIRDCFSKLFYLNVKITFRDLTQIEHYNELGYYTDYTKWNIMNNTQSPVEFSNAIVDPSFVLNKHSATTEYLKKDLFNHFVLSFFSDLKLTSLLKNKRTVFSNIIQQDVNIHNHLLQELKVFTDDGVLYEKDYARDISNNLYYHVNHGISVNSIGNSFRVLAGNILSPYTTNGQNNNYRKNIYLDQIKTIMDDYYQEHVDEIFYLKFTDSYDASNNNIYKYAGPLFFDISNTISYSDLFGNTTLSEGNVILKCYTVDYLEHVFYSIPPDMSGGYREYDLSLNEFSDSSSSIYTLISSSTTKTIVDLESFNSKLIPFRFMNGDSLNLLIRYKAKEYMSGSESIVPSDKVYKVNLNMLNSYYLYDKTSNTYYVYYNKEKFDNGDLQNENVLHSAFQNRGDPILFNDGWNYTLDYDINNNPVQQTEIVTSLYNSSLPHIKQAFQIIQLTQDNGNNYNNGDSNLTLGYFITDDFVDVSNDSSYWKTQEMGLGSVSLANSSTNSSYYITSSSSETEITQNNTLVISWCPCCHCCCCSCPDDSLTHSQDQPIFIIQILANKSIQNQDFLTLDIDTFTVNKKRNASGVTSFDHRLQIGVNMGDFAYSFEHPTFGTIEFQQIVANSNVFLVYPPSKVSSFQNDVSNNPSTYDISGYTNVFGGLYIQNVKKNEDTSQLLNNQSISYNIDTPVSKITMYLKSNTSQNVNFDPSDFTLRNITMNIKSTKIDYQYYTS